MRFVTLEMVHPLHPNPIPLLVDVAEVTRVSARPDNDAACHVYFRNGEVITVTGTFETVRAAIVRDSFLVGLEG